MRRVDEALREYRLIDFRVLSQRNAPIALRYLSYLKISVLYYYDGLIVSTINFM